jgi:DNA polymerase
MTSHSNFSPPALRAVRQVLESLQRAGVEQLPRGQELPWPAETSSSRPMASASVAESSATSVAAVAADPGRTRPAPAPEIAAVADTSAITTPTRIPPTPASRPQEPPMPPKRTKSDSKLPVPAKLSVAAKKERLAALCNEVAGCTRCPVLVSNRTQTVFGVGNPNTRLVFFGEAPGADEDRLGEPFVGRAGQLLDKIIEACTLKRRDVYILNTVKCRPPGNRNPEPEEVENCRPYHEQQLEIIRPEFICCLGSVAARALLNTKQPLGQLRGQLHPWRWAKVLVTYHPAYLLRNPPAKRDVWEDMKFLMKHLGIELS